MTPADVSSMFHAVLETQNRMEGKLDRALERMADLEQAVAADHARLDLCNKVVILVLLGGVSLLGTTIWQHVSVALTR